MLDAQDRAYRSVLDRSGPFGDRPSSYAEIAANLKGHSPATVIEAIRLSVSAGWIVQSGASYSLPGTKQAEIRAARRLL